MALTIPTLAPGLRIAVIGDGAQRVADALGISTCELDDADGAIFIASSIAGISDSTKAFWAKARDLYIPSIVVVKDFENGEIDFDDMAAIAGRILDPVVTPYLVLHSDDGAPVALIELETLKLFDYASGNREIRVSEPEHQELVKEFAYEFNEKVSEFGPTGFQDALIFPAIPYIEKIHMGKIEILEYLAQLPARG